MKYGKFLKKPISLQYFKCLRRHGPQDQAGNKYADPTEQTDKIPFSDF
jgi:hypothetical protein